MTTAIVILAEGCEEIEAVASIDVLRRAEVDVTVAGLTDGPVRASRGVVLVPDTTLEEVADRDFDAVVLPGGIPGATNLAADERVVSLIRRTLDAGRLVGAICASPAVVLAENDLLGDRRATCHPSLADRLGRESSPGRVVVDRNVVTSMGAGTAVEFALALVSELRGAEVAEEVNGPLLAVRDTIPE